MISLELRYHLYMKQLVFAFFFSTFCGTRNSFVPRCTYLGKIIHMHISIAYTYLYAHGVSVSAEVRKSICSVCTWICALRSIKRTAQPEGCEILINDKIEREGFLPGG